MGSQSSEQQWMNWYAEGVLAARLPDLREVAVRLATLHNEGKLDLLSLVENGELQSLTDVDFFDSANVLSALIPQIDAPVDRLMKVVESMVRRGGVDYAAGEPNAALRMWFASHPSEAQFVVDQATLGDDLASRHLTFALEATGDAAVARRLISISTGSCRVGALTALSRLEDTEEGYQATVSAIEAARPSPTEMTALIEQHSVLTLASVFARGSSSVRAEALAVISRIVDVDPPRLADSLAYALWLHPSLCEAETLPSLIEVAAKVDPSHVGTINRLDEIARKLVASNRLNEASRLILGLLKAGEGALNSSSFRGFMQAVHAKPPRELAKLSLEWLQSGNVQACEALHELLGQGELEGCKLVIDDDLLPTSSQDLLFLCGKAVGWLMFVPISATSIVCAVVRKSTGKGRQEAGDLLTTALLDNYHCAAKYVEDLVESDATWSCLKTFLEASASYIKAWASIPEIPELVPSDEHRRIQYLRASDEMREIRKGAETKSVFASMFKRAVILHGSSMVMLHHANDGAVTRTETPMGTYSVSKEVPRQLSIDPIGFDQLLRTLRYGSRAL